MNTLLFSISVIYLTLLFGQAHSFCAKPSEGLHADLTRAVVRSSDWLKQIYKTNISGLSTPRSASLFTALRLAGHHAHTLLSEFKTSKGLNIEETIRSTLDEVKTNNGDLSSIDTGSMGLTVLGIISICKNPEDFHGHNLITDLLTGFTNFNETSSFNNYFQYSLAVIALCNAGQKIPDAVVQELINGANKGISHNSVDTSALLLTALSCVSNSTKQSEVNTASGGLVQQLLSKQNTTTGAFGDEHATALAVQALQAAGSQSDSYLCDKAMRNILSYQDEEGSFGTILANIQVTPALLGESLISLRKYACPTATEPSTTRPPKIIKVQVRLIIDVTNLTRTELAVFVNVTEGSTAKTILDLAKLQNPCYTAQYQKYSFGHAITSICNVTSDWSKSQYWGIYINGRSSSYGVDDLIPKDGDIITFEYTKPRAPETKVTTVEPGASVNGTEDPTVKSASDVTTTEPGVSVNGTEDPTVKSISDVTTTEPGVSVNRTEDPTVKSASDVTTTEPGVSVNGTEDPTVKSTSDVTTTEPVASVKATERSLVKTTNVASDWSKSHFWLLLLLANIIGFF